MGVPDNNDGHVRKKQRLSLKFAKKKSGGESESVKEYGTEEAEKDSLESESRESMTTTESTDVSTSYTDTTTTTSSHCDLKVPAVASLENFGNTCFMNSIMQVLRYTPGFLENLATVYQNILNMEKIKKKMKSKDDSDTQKEDFDSENQRNSWNVVKSVYKVYRDQCLLEEKYEEIASDDVMSMAVKPIKVLKSVRVINPMYEGCMQHDAQEFLRCFLAYLQDAEKEIQSFSQSIPQTVKPKSMNPLMQKFLQLSKKEIILSSIHNSDKNAEKCNDVAGTNNKNEINKEVDKVKTALFKIQEDECESKIEDDKLVVTKETINESLEDDDKMMPKIGNTAENDAEDGGTALSIVQSANVPVENMGAFDLEKARKELKCRTIDKASSRKAREYSPYNSASRKTSKIKTKNSSNETLKADLKLNKKGLKKLKQPSIKDLYSKANRKKRLGMSRSVSKPVSNENLLNELDELKKECSGETENEDTNMESDSKLDRIKQESINNEIGKTMSETVQKDSEKQYPEGIVETKSEPCVSNQAYTNFLKALTSSLGEEIDTMSESDDEQALIKEKLIAKHLHDSPRRSPRKMQSQMIIPSPVLINKSVFSRSESDIKTVKANLNISFDSVSMSNENQSAENDVGSSGSKCVQNKSDRDISMDTESHENIYDSEISFKITIAGQTGDSKIALEPVIKLENCDYIFKNNETSVSATFAAKCLSPFKKSPPTFTNNYLKKRNLLDSLDTDNTEELEKALEAMLNSPVKSNSKCDFIERLFQGTMMLRTRCMSCETSTERQEEFHDISVPVRIEQEEDSDDEGDQNEKEPEEGRCSLLDVIEASTEVEKLQDDNQFYCDKCMGYQEAERSIHYDVMPNILTLHLKRFYAKSGNYSYLSKINDAVDIPLVLSCLRYKCPQSCLRPDHRYKLYAVITHTGVTLTSGHYMAYVKARENKKSTSSQETQDKGSNKTVLTAPESQKADVSENPKSGQAHSTRGKSGIAPKLPSRFDQNIVANTKVKAFANITDKSKKKDSQESLHTNKMFDTQWFECDDETIRVFEESEFQDLLSEKSGSLLGTPYLLFYHKSTLY